MEKPQEMEAAIQSVVLVISMMVRHEAHCLQSSEMAIGQGHHPPVLSLEYKEVTT